MTEILEDLRALVERESPSDDPSRVTALAEWVAARLTGSRVEAKTVPCPPSGDGLLAGFERGEGGTLLLGHLDTVWPAGTLERKPFAVRDGIATGPGVFDMKAGIAVAIGALDRLGRGIRPPRVSLLLTPDEEIGTTASRALLLESAAAHRRVLVLEPSLSGAAKIARKGTGLFEASFSGRGAHAGLEPEKGASALAEMSRFVLYLETLADAARGTTVTPTVASAGSKSNVVPDSARLVVDVRAWTLAERDRVRAAVLSYAPRDGRVRIEIAERDDRPPLEPTRESLEIYEAAKRIASGLGWELGAERVGGASDGNLTAAQGIPTLDGLGPDGGGAHAEDEFVRVDDLPRRVELLCRLVEELA